MNTKEKILEASLRLFGEKGYGDVYVGEIADAVGIKAPSLYKHFKNKQEIFDALIGLMKEKYTENVQKIGVDGNDAAADVPVFENMSEEILIDTGTGLFLYFLHDPHMSGFRKILTLEQYRNKDLSKIYTKQFFEDPIAYQSALFASLKDAGMFIDTDPQLLALEFYSPIYTLLTVCDRDPSFENEALRLIEAHIRQFDRNYRKDL